MADKVKSVVVLLRFINGFLLKNCRLSSLYTTLMDFHDYGKALYQVTSDEVTPGKVGYFDRKGTGTL